MEAEQTILFAFAAFLRNHPGMSLSVPDSILMYSGDTFLVVDHDDKLMTTTIRLSSKDEIERLLGE